MDAHLFRGLNLRPYHHIFTNLRSLFCFVATSEKVLQLFSVATDTGLMVQ
jgi:hypothetical protein